MSESTLDVGELPGVRCPKCKSARLKVLKTQYRGAKTVRTKECKCGRRIRAVEQIENADVPKRPKADPIDPAAAA